jgi:hypothetical protein
MDDTNYAGWTWETVLGNVLNVAMPDRSAVTGQQWLVIEYGNDTLPAAHEFWNASWTASTTKAAGAISVYLNPALADPASPVSLFQAAPGALAGVPDGAYSTPTYGPLPMQPPAFKPVGQALANTTDWFAAAAQQFNRMGQSARASISGEAAQMFADLFGRLGTVATSLYDQMSDPVSYANAIADTAGGAAVSFLAGLWSAYSNWTQQPAYTPSGAIVQVLQAVGQLQPDGTYVINDPENTTYGDLTTDQGWATVEQRAKNLWLGLLTTGTGSFGGLDPLAHTALSSLISQYDSAITVLQPVTGASPPASRSPAAPSPVGGPNNPVRLGAGPGPPPPGAPPAAPPPANLVLAPVGPGAVPGAPPPGAPPAAPPPAAPPPAGLVLAPVGPGAVPGAPPAASPPAGLGPAPAGLAAAPAPGPPPSPSPGGGPSNPPAVFGSALTIRNASVVQGPPNAPPTGGPDSNPPASPPASPPGGPAFGGLKAIGPVAAFAAGSAAAAATTSQGPVPSTLVPAGTTLSAGTPPAAVPAVLSGAIGAVSNDTSGALGDQAAPQTSPLASPGAPLAEGALLPIAIGKTSEASDQAAESGNAAPNPNQSAPPARVAPVAGATLGRGVNGTALTQAKVPTLSAKPPPIRSSAINTQVTATVANPAAASPAGTLHIDAVSASGAPGGTPGSLNGTPGSLTQAPAANPNATGHDILTTFMVDQNGEPYVGVNGPMMMPQATMGVGGGGFGGRPMGRQSYLPEDEDSWGTDPEEPDAAIGAPHNRRRYQPTPEEAEEAEISSSFGAIGRRGQPS